MTTHACPVAGCTRLLPGHVLMCKTHWYMTPAPLRRQVYRAWNNGRVQPDYLTVRAEAIKAVEAQL